MTRAGCGLPTDHQPVIPSEPAKRVSRGICVKIPPLAARYRVQLSRNDKRNERAPGAIHARPYNLPPVFFQSRKRTAPGRAPSGTPPV